MVDRESGGEDPTASTASVDGGPKLRCCLSAAEAGTWEWDVATGSLAWSPELFRLYDVDPAHTPLRHSDWERCLHPEDRDATNREVLDVLEGLTSDFRSEFRIVRRDGSVRWVLTIGTAIRDAQGRVAKLRGINLDVTEHKRNEQALWASEAQFRAMVRASSDVIYRLSPDWSELRQLAGRRVMPDAAQPNLNWLEMYVHPDDRGRIQAEIERVIREKAIFEMELRVLRPDGGPGWASSRVIPILDERGEIVEWLGMASDVTARKEAELALAHLNQTLEQRVQDQTGQIRLLAAALEHLADGVIITDDELDWPGPKIRFVNAALCRITGYPAAELIGQTPRLLQGELSDPQVMADLKRELAAGRPFLCEVVNHRKDGSPYDAELFISPLYDSTGRRTNFVAIHRDVTERNRMGHALRDREQRLSAILASAFDAIVTIDRAGIIVSANPATERLFGYSQNELVGRNVSMLMASPHRDEHDSYIRRYVETGVARIIGSNRVGLGLRKNGDTFPVDLSISAINQHGFTGIIRDLSERKSLQKHVLEVAEEEQRRIGQELHDGVQQELTGLSLIAGTITDDLLSHPSFAPQPSVATASELDTPTSSPNVRATHVDTAVRVRALLARLTSGLSDCARHVQLLSRGIMPVQVDGLGLHSALHELARTTNMAGGVDCECDIDERATIDDAATATHLYRITQEAVNNAIKHGRASRIRLSLEHHDDRTILEVSDNGGGIDPTTFDVASPPAAGMGLRIMAYRSSLIGGTLRFLRSLDGGTIVRCMLQRRGGASP